MRRSGSRSLGEFPLDVVRIECERCGRVGSYRRDGSCCRGSAESAAFAEKVPIGTPTPSRETHSRPLLTRLDADDRIAVWRDVLAAANGASAAKMTADRQES